MKTYGPGEYTVEVTLRLNTFVDEGETAVEADLLENCRQFGEMVDWEVID